MTIIKLIFVRTHYINAKIPKVGGVALRGGAGSMQGGHGDLFL